MNRDENFKKFELFFKCDLAIKKELIKLKYPDENSFIDEDLFNYYDLLVSGIQKIRELFLQMVKSLELPFEEEVNQFFSNLEKELSNISYDYDKLKSFYIHRLSDMRDEFINAVNYDNKGYTIIRPNTVYLAHTVNEMLHAIHKYVINNENILKSLPIREIIERPYNDDYILYGDDDSLAKDILYSLDISSNAGMTDIIAVNSSQKIIMMVRDKGHALSIEIDIGSDNKCLVSYFIPKVCNPDLVNVLPGVRKVDNTSQFTDGKFIVAKEELPATINDFISKVPTDLEITDDWKPQKTVLH